MRKGKEGVEIRIHIDSAHLIWPQQRSTPLFQSTPSTHTQAPVSRVDPGGAVPLTHYPVLWQSNGGGRR